MCRASFIGVWAVVVTPRWLSTDRLGSLLTLSTDHGRVSKTPLTPIDSQLAIRVSRHTLHTLARLPASPWRNTCLFKSASECLILRRLGVPARIALGVKKESSLSSDATPVQAHAWVETAPSPHPAPDTLDASYTPLQRSAIATASPLNHP